LLQRLQTPSNKTILLPVLSWFISQKQSSAICGKLVLPITPRMSLYTRIFFVFISFFAGIVAIAQKSYSTRDSIAIYNFCDKSGMLMNENNRLDSALHYAQKALTQARSVSFKRGEAAALIRLAEILFKRSETKLIDSLNTAALKVAELLKDNLLVAAACRNAGIFTSYFSKQKEAIIYFERALSVKYEAEQSVTTADLYNKIGNANMELGELDNQMQWQTKSLKLYEKWNDKKGEAAVLDNLAGLYLELGKNKEAIDYAKRSVAICEQLNNYERMAQCYNNLSQIYHFSDSVKSAIYFGDLGLRYAEMSGIKNKMAHAYTTQTLLLNRERKNDEALAYEKKAIAVLEQTGDDIMLSRRYISAAILSQSKEVNDSAGAVYYYQRAIDLASRINSRMNLRDAYLFRSGFYRSHKNFEQAYTDYSKHILYRDSVLNDETKSRIADIETKYETEKKDNEIKGLYVDQRIKELQLEKQKGLRNFLIAGILLALMMGAIVFNRYQIKKKLEKQTELLAMRNNISQNLHDDIGASLSNINILNELVKRNLSNTEKSKEYLAKSGEDIQRISESLSDIVWNINPRYDDLQHLFIRMKRYAADMLDGKNIKYEFNFPDNAENISLSMDNRRDLYLLFKEAVNNLVKYSQATSASISIEGGEKNLKMIISDNGIGFNTEEIRSGNGLNNIEQRATKLNGQLSIVSKNGNGTRIELTMFTT
jgi:signal transduction histidine kinase